MDTAKFMNSENGKTSNPHRGQNNARSLDMTELICHLIGHKFSQFSSFVRSFCEQNLKIV